MPSMEYARPPPSPDRPPIPMRRRFGRFSPKTKFFAIKRGSADSAIAGLDVPSPYSSAGLPIREMNHLRSSSLDENPFAGNSQPNASLPPDLSDAKWLDYVENNTLERQVSQEDESRGLGAVPKPMRKRPPPLIPELSHLRMGRPSLDSSSEGSSSMPNSASTTASMRRQAKTPVFRIGQLEQKREARMAKTSSVELIAEQYTAFLEHRDALEEELAEENENVVHLEEGPRPRPLNAGSLKRKEVPRQRSEDSNVNVVLEPVRASKIVQGRPYASADNVHEHEAIYFRPVSFSPDSSPSLGSQDFPSITTKPSTIRHSQTPDSLSLQICLDLLKRELTPRQEQQQQKDETTSSSSQNAAAALQIWVMIEAYERLQNQVAEMELSDKDRGNMEVMLRGWLETLYAVHRGMVGRCVVSEGELEGLEEAVD